MSTDECYAVHLLEGQNIIKELALIHDLKGKGFLFYRDCVLSSLPLISLLKHGETFGFYIDSPSPYFAFKVEMSEHGHLRTLMLPDDFSDFPKEIDGTARVTKLIDGKSPYNSIIKLVSATPEMASNQIIKESYQMNGELILSPDSDQSILIMKLPRKSWDKDEILPEGKPFKEFKEDVIKNMDTIFNKGENDEQAIIKKMESLDFYHLKSKDVQFKCSCSRERMIMGVSSLLSAHTLDEIFEGKKDIETKCDYCKTFYQILRTDIENSIKH
jgi:molecular chaperone Hsp33